MTVIPLDVCDSLVSDGVMTKDAAEALQSALMANAGTSPSLPAAAHDVFAERAPEVLGAIARFFGTEYLEANEVRWNRWPNNERLSSDLSFLLRDKGVYRIGMNERDFLLATQNAEALARHQDIAAAVTAETSIPTRLVLTDAKPTLESVLADARDLPPIARREQLSRWNLRSIIDIECIDRYIDDRSIDQSIDRSIDLDDDIDPLRRLLHRILEHAAESQVESISVVPNESCIAITYGKHGRQMLMEETSPRLGAPLARLVQLHCFPRRRGETDDRERDGHLLGSFRCRGETCLLPVHMTQSVHGTGFHIEGPCFFTDIPQRMSAFTNGTIGPELLHRANVRRGGLTIVTGPSMPPIRRMVWEAARLSGGDGATSSLIEHCYTCPIEGVRHVVIGQTGVLPPVQQIDAVAELGAQFIAIAVPIDRAVAAAAIRAAMRGNSVIVALPCRDAIRCMMTWAGLAPNAELGFRSVDLVIEAVSLPALDTGRAINADLVSAGIAPELVSRFAHAGAWTCAVNSLSSDRYDLSGVLQIDEQLLAGLATRRSIEALARDAQSRGSYRPASEQALELACRSRVCAWRAIELCA